MPCYEKYSLRAASSVASRRTEKAFQPARYCQEQEQPLLLRDEHDYLHIEVLEDMEVPVSGSYLPVFVERFAPAC